MISISALSCISTQSASAMGWFLFLKQDAKLFSEQQPSIMISIEFCSENGLSFILNMVMALSAEHVHLLNVLQHTYAWIQKIHNFFQIWMITALMSKTVTMCTVFIYKRWGPCVLGSQCSEKSSWCNVLPLCWRDYFCAQEHSNQRQAVSMHSHHVNTSDTF